MTIPPLRDRKEDIPDLVSYSKSSGPEKKYDRIAAMETLKAIVSLGYRIEKAN
jgi:transcriptional regulator with PAS, ATPase and Fis domain